MAEAEERGAFKYLRQAYLDAPSEDFSIRAACSLMLLQQDFPDSWKKGTVLFQSLEMSKARWTPEIIKERFIDRKKERRLLSKPGLWAWHFTEARYVQRLTLDVGCCPVARNTSGLQARNTVYWDCRSSRIALFGKLP